jgi:heme/copper-type cytochrome/quinol oxidase subunit 2
MPNNRYIYAGGGILYALLVVALIAAKLAGHLHWAWLLILLPVWGPVVLFVLLILFAIAWLGDASAKGENPFQ